MRAQIKAKLDKISSGYGTRDTPDHEAVRALGKCVAEALIAGARADIPVIFGKDHGWRLDLQRPGCMATLRLATILAYALRDDDDQLLGIRHKAVPELLEHDPRVTSMFDTLCDMDEELVAVVARRVFVLPQNLAARGYPVIGDPSDGLSWLDRRMFAFKQDASQFFIKTWREHEPRRWDGDSHGSPSRKGDFWIPGLFEGTPALWQVDDPYEELLYEYLILGRSDRGTVGGHDYTDNFVSLLIHCGLQKAGVTKNDLEELWALRQSDGLKPRQHWPGSLLFSPARWLPSQSTFSESALVGGKSSAEEVRVLIHASEGPARLALRPTRSPSYWFQALLEAVLAVEFSDAVEFTMERAGWSGNVNDGWTKPSTDEEPHVLAISRTFLKEFQEHHQDSVVARARAYLLEEIDINDYDPDALARVIGDARDHGSTHPASVAFTEMYRDLERLGLAKEYRKLDIPPDVILESAALRLGDYEDWKISVDDLIKTAKTRATHDPLAVVAELSFEEISELCDLREADKWKSLSPIRLIELGPAELSYEGVALGHCVGRRSLGYHARVTDGRIRILSIQTVSGKRLFTVEVSDASDWLRSDGQREGPSRPEIQQIRGRYNRLPGFKPKRSGAPAELDPGEHCVVNAILDKSGLQDDVYPMDLQRFHDN